MNALATVTANGVPMAIPYSCFSVTNDDSKANVTKLSAGVFIRGDSGGDLSLKRVLSFSQISVYSYRGVVAPN